MGVEMGDDILRVVIANTFERGSEEDDAVDRGGARSKAAVDPARAVSGERISLPKE